LKQFRLGLRHDTDAGVLHREAQPDLVRLRLLQGQDRNREANLTRLRELDGIVDQIDQNLFQPLRIGDQVAQPGRRRIDHQPEALGFGDMA